MDRYKPSCCKVDEVVEHICVRDTVQGCIDCNTKEAYTGNMPESACDTWYHLATCQCLNEENEWHDGKNIVVGRKRCEPLNRKIMYPDDEDR